MMTQSPPIVSIQPPKDVSLSEIEAELLEIWHSYGSGGDIGGDFPTAIRATTFTLVVYEPEETQQMLSALGYYSGPIDGIVGPRMVAALKAAQKTYGLQRTGRADPTTKDKLRQEYSESLDTKDNADEVENLQYSADQEGAGIADAIAAANPCRIIALCPIAGEDRGVTAQVSASCPISKHSQSTLVCCEYITLTGTATALERIGGVISELMIGELPKFIWWKGTPDTEYGLFKRLAGLSDNIIIDSSSFSNQEAKLLQMYALSEEGIAIADLNWRRLAPWQELSAEAFDPPERRAALKEVDRVTIDYEKGNVSQALMYLGWLASRLNWRPVSYQKEDGDYEIRRVNFSSPDQHSIEAELAAIPIADVGEIPGDLISLRLGSTNMDADCCTVLCSETTGCMRMEAHGGAQSCRIQQVTPLFDQKTEQLLSQELQRWGRDKLYQESLAVTAQIIKLGH
ncbi:MULTISPECIES: glucose-6-phosphate dehydrogenase assembly protein OpcA [unclassified Coleofasciculus]|uniref:glucose-6-phosphate dehydrogenase assembly protein OpcA n=1 Tax=unclassified Coleofasciculus TaxID=2692782 RepID=UPI00187EA6A9|nr:MULTISPECIES: glucose-6-phosphate dehydrogenase assembly protein OpcA [unclassified Coleofasciculus]MBE9126678.1 glucose-6-phosphate dehydrogenase assembly protein OpcA [Coleofasciculus sp. LEGE 07081]MBE9150772.1 glucose-6-phosphate dehydrogenase assembly protein OpcA [Coleofasciculus sp. LEGE 07092]